VKTIHVGGNDIPLQAITMIGRKVSEGRLDEKTNRLVYRTVTNIHLNNGTVVEYSGDRAELVSLIRKAKSL